MARVFNFSAGPSTLPLPVLERAQAELLDYRGSGMSVMEMSHRSAHFEDILHRARTGIRSLLGLGDEFEVLFLQGGASMQFAMVPMAFLAPDAFAEYVVTGSWGVKALQAAQISAPASRSIWDGKSDGYVSAPAHLDVSPEAAYVHFTSNETIEGVQFQSAPDAGNVPLVCDMSSDFLSRTIDASRYSLIYAGAQKNLGPAGLTVILIRKDFLAKERKTFAPMLQYGIHAKNDSMYNTPPCWSIYVSGLVTDWLQENGGLAAMAEINRTKAAILYGAVDSSDEFYQGHAQTSARSSMNVVFRLQNADLTDRFVAEAQEAGLDGLKGHRSVGGCRASIYNAFPTEGCERLAQFMREFAHRHR